MADQPTTQRTVIIQHAGLRSVGAFAAFPTKILRNAVLSIGARLTYGLLLSYAWQEDFCFPAQEQLAKDLGVTDRHVRRFLIELRDKGMIDWKQQGLNRPNVYYILEIEPTKPGSPSSDTENSNEYKDRTYMSGPDRTSASTPDRTPRSGQERTQVSDYKETITNKHKVVNDVTGNDPKSNSRNPDRPAAGKTPTINPRTLRGKYGLTDDQIGQVFRLVDKQVDVLAAGERNHGNYVKRAAEAVRDGQGDLLDHVLSDFKQAATATTVAVGSRPAYFHAMYTEALEKRRAEDAIRSVSTPTLSTVPPAAGPPTVGDLFAARTPSRSVVTPDDTRSRMIADAERRGFSVPDFIRSGDTRAVTQWWAAMMAEVEKSTKT